MKNKLFRKYYYTTILVVLIFALFLMVALSLSISNFLSVEKRNLLSENCRTISTLVQESYNDSYFMSFGLKNVMSVTAGAIDADIFFTDTQGKTFICSCREWNESGYCMHSKSLLPAAILKAALKAEYYEVGNLGGNFSNVYYTNILPMQNTSGQTVALIVTASPASSLRVLFSGLVKTFLVASLVPIIFIFLFVYATSFRLSKPLRLMSEAAKSISKGDFSKRIPVKGDDEIAELASSFNQMTNSLVQLESMRRNFIANVSHELKTPMTTIGGFIDGILDGTIVNEQQGRYLQIVSHEVKRLSRLVQTMLSLAKLESGKLELNPQNTDLSEIIFATLVSQEQRIEQKQLNIEGLDDLSDVQVLVDQDLFHQVVYNLLDNAIKFNNENGYIRFSLVKKEGKTGFIIRNSGAGIHSEDLPYVFERFYKADKARSANKESTGLGLYIVKTVVDLHQGKITVRSKAGEYTEFEVLLPAQKIMQ